MQIIAEWLYFDQFFVFCSPLAKVGIAAGRYQPLCEMSYEECHIVMTIQLSVDEDG